MKKLLNGIVEFRNKVRPQYQATFARLALGQKPDALLIACSDSRVAVNLFASTEPGDLFVVRNPGNIIPACCPQNDEHNNSEAAALEFALKDLDVKDIIVCGHSECGAMRALARGHDQLENCYLKRWLKNVQDTPLEWEDVEECPDAPHNKLSQQNVILQMQHLKSYPLVQKKMSEGLRIHGWWFEVSQAEVYCFDESKRRFVVIDEKEAQRILLKVSG